MKSKKAKHGQTILAYVVLILLSFLCIFMPVLLLHPDCKCDALPCGSAERIFGDPGNLFSGKSEERGK